MNSTTPLPLALVSGEYSRLRSVGGITARRREDDDDDDDDKDDVVEERSSHVEVGPAISTARYAESSGGEMVPRGSNYVVGCRLWYQ